jgi:hypothetical protein
MSVIEPTSSSVCTRVVLRAKPQCTGKCDKLLACLDKLLLTRNFRPSGTNLQPRAIMPLLSMARRAQVFLRAWLSMPPQIATHTTVPIVTAAVILNRRTDRTRKCTSKVTRHALRTMRCQRHCNTVCLTNQYRSIQKSRLRHLLPIRPPSFNDFPSWGPLHSCRGSM